MDDTDDRFVGRRGSQGEDWHWEGEPAPEPTEAAPGPGPSLSGAFRRIGRWLASSFAGVRDFLGRTYKPPKPVEPGPVADTSPPPAEPEAVSEAPQAGADREPAVSLEPISTPERPKTLGGVIKWSRIVPRLPRERPRVAVPWSKVAGERPRLSLHAPRQAEVPQDAGSLLLLLASIGLAAAIVIGVVIAVDTLGSGGGNGGLVGDVTATPKTTLIPPASETPAPSESPSPTPSPSASPTPSASASPSPTSATHTPTPGPTQAPPPATSSPQGAVAVALWANRSNTWWFGGLTSKEAQYEEGQEVPLMVQWDGAAGQTYWVRITYACSTAGVLGGIDYLSGVQSWGREIVYATYGPAQDLPNGAITVPDTQGFAPDDENAGLFSVYGGKFPVLPESPTPSGACPGQRTISLPVLASGGKVTLLASGHLGAASLYGSGNGAASSSSALSVIGSVDGVGLAVVSIDPSAISDTPH